MHIVFLPPMLSCAAAPTGAAGSSIVGHAFADAPLPTRELRSARHTG
jgi:hypothetical protein